MKAIRVYGRDLLAEAQRLLHHPNPKTLYT